MPGTIKRTSIWFALGMLVLVALALAACQPTATPTAAPAEPTAAPTQPPAPTAAPTEAPTAAPTAAPAQPSPTPIPFTGTAQMLAIYPKQSVMVSRVDDPKTQQKLMTPGLNVVPPGVPQYVVGGAIGLAKDAKVASFEWKIAGPDGSTVTIAEAPADEKSNIPAGAATFTPDKTGTYTITVVAKDGAGTASLPGEMKVEVATYVGADACKGCHADQYNGWSTTGHATFFKEQVDKDPEGEYKNAGFGCARCHTVGYYPITKLSTGGFWDVAVNVLKFVWPKDKIGKEGTFDAFPAELKAVSNIQCESCHGPAGNHNGDPTKIATSMDSGSCNQCHNDGHFHIRGEQLQNAGHAQAASLTPANGRAACARCHSPEGFVDFTKGVAADKLRTQVGELGCATCHDPHSNTNFAQLRVVGEVKDIPIEVKDAGLSAVCMECHNARNTAEKIVTDKPEFPHYSAATEALNAAGGFDFGVKIPDSPHATMIGQSPVKDADGADMFGAQKPGSCVYCHMYTTPGGNANAKEVNGKEVEVTDPGHNQVGAHSFNMVSADGVENIAACKSCHADATSFDLTAKADYDGNGKAEGVQEEIKGLLALVKEQLIAQGVKATDSHPYFTNPDNPSTEINGAEYNYRFVMGVIPTGEGAAAAIHNFQRSAALLQISYAKLAGKDVPNATILYTK